MGIQLASNFTLNAALPLDDRTAVANGAARDAIPTGRRYAGLKVYVVADDKTYKWNGTVWTEDGGAPAPNMLVSPKQVTANYTILATDNVILVNAAGGNITLTLPDPTTVKQLFYIVRTDSTVNTVTIVDATTGTIDGAANAILEKQWDAVIISPDHAANWVLHARPSTSPLTNAVIATANYTVQSTENFIVVDAGTGNVTVTLPNHLTYKKPLFIKRIDNTLNTVTLVPTGGALIDGAANLQLKKQYEAVILGVYSGTSWSILSKATVSVSTAVVTKTANYSATVDDAVILVDTTTANVTITLPSPALFVGILRIKKTDSSVNTVTIAPNAAETIEGAANFIIYDQYVSQSLVSNGTNWSFI